MWFAFGNGNAPVGGDAECYRPARDVVAARHGEDTVLLSGDQGRYFTLNEVGTRVWELLHSSPTVDQVITALRSEYDAPPLVIERDVTGLIADLRRANLIDRV